MKRKRLREKREIKRERDSREREREKGGGREEMGSLLLILPGSLFFRGWL